MNYEELVTNHAGEMVERLVSWAVNTESVDIHFDYEGNDQWAILSMHVYEEDKEISLRLHSNNQYDLYFGYYDDEDEFFEIVKPLNEKEQEVIPEGLQKLMKHVVDKEEGMRIPGNFLARK